MTRSGPIRWNDALLTGVEEIDRQHRVLVDALNEARTKLSTAASDPLFERITRDLLSYAIYHFESEEGLMRSSGFEAAEPEATAEHLAHHRQFSERLVALRDAGRQGEPGANVALIALLEDWLFNHIMTTDKRLGTFILAKR